MRPRAEWLFGTEVEIHYSEHFTPEGQASDGATPGATHPAAAPTWVTLNACSVGDGYVRLVASDMEHVIEEESVTVTPRGVVGQAPLKVELDDVTSRELTPGGSGDRFEVSASGLSSAKTYELNTVVLNGISAAFNRGCTNFKKTETIGGRPPPPRATPRSRAPRRGHISGRGWKR